MRTENPAYTELVLDPCAISKLSSKRTFRKSLLFTILCLYTIEYIIKFRCIMRRDIQSKKEVM